jgi:hypothetical protein
MKVTRVRMGSNEFIECEAPLALGDKAMLAFSVEGGALRVLLDVPAPPARTAVSVRDNHAAGKDVNVRVDGNRVTIHVGDRAVLSASLVGSDEVDVAEFDLRPIGVDISATSMELQVGRAVVAGNSFIGARFGMRIDLEGDPR